VIDPESLEEIERQVADTASPAFAVDLGGRVVAWNQQAEEMFGTPTSEAIGRPCAMVVRGADRAGQVVC